MNCTLLFSYLKISQYTNFKTRKKNFRACMFVNLFSPYFRTSNKSRNYIVMSKHAFCTIRCVHYLQLAWHVSAHISFIFALFPLVISDTKYVPSKFTLRVLNNTYWVLHMIESRILKGENQMFFAESRRIISSMAMEGQDKKTRLAHRMVALNRVLRLTSVVVAFGDAKIIRADQSSSLRTVDRREIDPRVF